MMCCMPSLNYIKVACFSTARYYVQRHRWLKKGIKKKTLMTENKRKNDDFLILKITRKAMNYRERGEDNYVIFTLPLLTVR